MSTGNDYVISESSDIVRINRDWRMPTGNDYVIYQASKIFRVNRYWRMPTGNDYVCLSPFLRLLLSRSITYITIELKSDSYISCLL